MKTFTLFSSIGFIGRTLVLAAVMLAPVYVRSQQQPTTQERVAAFKQQLAKNQGALRRYEWIETTTISVKGEVKSVKQNRCYYGADGKIQKVLVNESAPQAAPSGRGGRLKGRIMANKKEEMTEYMKQAVDLVHKYVPPDPSLVQNAKDAEKIGLSMVEPKRVIRLDFRDFIKPGDLLSAALNLQSSAILNVDVSTYLETANDVVVLAVAFNQLPDGTNYAARTTLDAKAKNVRVMIENTGHKQL